MNVDYLQQGDCLELMKQIPDGSVDLILTDPPYGISYSSSRVKDKQKRLGGILNDKEPFISFIETAMNKIRETGAMYIFVRWDVQQRFIDEVSRCGGKVKNVLIWDKGAHGMGDLKSSYGSKYESILFVPGSKFRFPGKRPTDIICEKKVPASELKHPNEKPVSLMERLIEDATTNGMVVFDPFAGSGSTCVAAVNTGRHYIGFELDEKYFQIACDRVGAAKKGAEHGDLEQTQPEQPL